MNQDKHSNCLKETEISEVHWTKIEKNHLSRESHETRKFMRKYNDSKMEIQECYSLND